RVRRRQAPLPGERRHGDPDPAVRGVGPVAHAVTAAAARRRARPPLADWLVFALLLVAPGKTVAQVTQTVPADAAGADTVVVPIPPDPEERDTAGVARAQQDTAALVPVPPFPRYDRPGRNGFAFGRWEWDRQALLRYHSLSLLSLLERTPGLS